jgi:hypothetical protein
VRRAFGWREESRSGSIVQGHIPGRGAGSMGGTGGLWKEGLEGKGFREVKGHVLLPEGAQVTTGRPAPGPLNLLALSHVLRKPSGQGSL